MRVGTSTGRCDGASWRKYIGHNPGEAVFQFPWGTGAEISTQDEAKVECAGMDEQPFQDVVVVSQVRAPHAAGIVYVGEAAFDEFAAFTHERFASLALDASAVGIHRLSFVRLVLPVAPSPVRLADVGARRVRVIAAHHGVAVIAFVSHDFAQRRIVQAALGIGFLRRPLRGFPSPPPRSGQ